MASAATLAGQAAAGDLDHVDARERAGALSPAHRRRGGDARGSGGRVATPTWMRCAPRRRQSPTIIRFCRALGCAACATRRDSRRTWRSASRRYAVGPNDDMQTVTHKVLQGAISARQPEPYGRRPEMALIALGATGRLLRRGQRVDVHGQRRAGTLRPARARRRCVLRCAPAVDFAATSEQARRGAGHFVRRAAAPRGEMAKEQRAMVVAITQPGTPLHRRRRARRRPRLLDARRHRGVPRADHLPRDPGMVGVGLALAVPRAFRRLKRVREALKRTRNRHRDAAGACPRRDRVPGKAMELDQRHRPRCSCAAVAPSSTDQWISFVADVCIDGGRIAAIGPDLRPLRDRAGGQIAPGFIDVHARRPDRRLDAVEAISS